MSIDGTPYSPNKRKSTDEHAEKREPKYANRTMDINNTDDSNQKSEMFRKKNSWEKREKFSPIIHTFIEPRMKNLQTQFSRLIESETAGHHVITGHPYRDVDARSCQWWSAHCYI